MAHNTPMSRFKHQLDTIETLTKKFFTIHSLNGSAPKENSYTGKTSKGVAHDYILLFQPKPHTCTHNQTNFAFGFTFLHTDLEKSILTISITSTKSYISHSYIFAEAKVKLNEFVKMLSVLDSINQITDDAIFKSLTTVFSLTSEASSKSTETLVNELSNTLTKKATDSKKELKKIKTKFLKSQAKLNEKNAVIEEKLESVKLALNYKAAMKAFTEAKLALDAINLSLKKCVNESKIEFKISELEKEMSEARSNFQSILQTQKLEMNAALKQYPPQISKQFLIDYPQIFTLSDAKELKELGINFR